MDLKLTGVAGQMNEVKAVDSKLEQKAIDINMISLHYDDSMWFIIISKSMHDCVQNYINDEPEKIETLLEAANLILRLIHFSSSKSRKKNLFYILPHAAMVLKELEAIYLADTKCSDSDRDGIITSISLLSNLLGRLSTKW